jgi:short-subunit dehydrogenase
MNTIETKGTALITGASTGIGAVYADRLAKRGHDLIFVARDKGRLASLARRIANDTGRKVETVEADLTSPTDLRRVEDILRTHARVSVLVNNASVGATAPLLNTDVDKMDDMIRLNVTALMRLDTNVTTFTSPAELAHALRRAEAAHGEHEKRTGVRDANWSDWYAEYLAAEQTGKELPS